MNDDELQKLIQKYLEGRLSVDEFKRLESYLQDKPDARREYIESARMDAALQDAHYEQESKSPIEESELKQQNSWLHKLGWGWIAATAVVGVFSFLIITWLPKTDLPKTDLPETGLLDLGIPVQSVAVITAQAGAKWKNEDFQVGSSLEPSFITLEEGIAQIDFYGGAAISLSAPAKFELINEHKAVLHYGRIKAQVPPAARGFEILANEVLLEDLGTSFGLEVNYDTGKADLLVFDGEVRLTGKSGTPIHLTEGLAANLTDGEPIRQSPVRPDRFSNISDVVAASANAESLRYSEWKESSKRIAKDQRLIAYYDFEDLTPSTRRLKNRTTKGLDEEFDGGIVGARLTNGRWSEKPALDFRSEGDRVCFDIPGEWEALSLFAWVRIDALDRFLNSLFLTDHFDPYEIHWQISKTGFIHFSTSPTGVFDLNENNRRFYSEGFWTPADSGKWFLLAVTVEQGTGKVQNYINGKEIPVVDGLQHHKPIEKLRIGKSDLGNWSKPINQGSIRSLNGRIDEFGIFSVVLSSDEIADIYEMGKPY